MEDRLHVVAIEVENERRVVVAAVFGAPARPTVVGGSVIQGDVMPPVDRGGIRGGEGHVRSGSHAVPAGLGADAVDAEVVVALTAEEDVRVALEFPLAEDGETEFGQGSPVHPPARRKVVHSDPHVVDDPAHRAESIPGWSVTWSVGHLLAVERTVRSE